MAAPQPATDSSTAPLRRPELRILVYSHDTYGLGNIRRMVGVCEGLLSGFPGASVLLVTASPMVHDLRLPAGLDYVKLPCLRRSGNNQYEPRDLAEDLGSVVRVRAAILEATVASYEPDIVIVDKKPLGVENELGGALAFLRRNRPSARMVLLLRDILDGERRTREIWRRNRYHDAIAGLYDLVLVAGLEELFDVCAAYDFPPSTTTKVRYCGYLERRMGPSSVEGGVRKMLGLDAEKLVLVTVGGGEDGAPIIRAYLDGLLRGPESCDRHSVIITGPEMSDGERIVLERAVHGRSDVTILTYARDILEFMAAADLVVCMGGYNTTCEVLTLTKPAIVIPRAAPVAEQLIRARQLSEMGLIRMIHPEELSAARLAGEVETALTQTSCADPRAVVDLGGLDRLVHQIGSLRPSADDRSPLARCSLVLS